VCAKTGNEDRMQNLLTVGKNQVLFFYIDRPKFMKFCNSVADLMQFPIPSQFFIGPILFHSEDIRH